MTASGDYPKGFIEVTSYKGTMLAIMQACT